MHASSSQPMTLVDAISREYLVHHRVCPKAFAADGSIIVAISANAHLDAIDDIGFSYRCAVVTEITPDEEVERLIERLTNRTERSIELARADGEIDDFTADVRDLANQVPVVRYVNLLVRDAYDAGASDIHLEATRSGLSARVRVDGVLVPALEPPP